MALAGPKFGRGGYGSPTLNGSKMRLCGLWTGATVILHLARALPQRPWFPLDAKPGFMCAFHVADLTILPLSVEP
ncbi:hypothetical protein CFAM422_005704 [Trichoderma lentiforme]|uniref:Uncharacterized protein n=1 Tax=Trichoderma lentiforme TaxID=1567552 RepID=A0A9P4XG07_9HYPO|nr:hypothetical protein CFAM422_005704 [Trichoderma lentiforme]